MTPPRALLAAPGAMVARTDRLDDLPRASKDRGQREGRGAGCPGAGSGTFGGDGLTREGGGLCVGRVPATRGLRPGRFASGRRLLARTDRAPIPRERTARVGVGLTGGAGPGGQRQREARGACPPSGGTACRGRRRIVVCRGEDGGAPSDPGTGPDGFDGLGDAPPALPPQRAADETGPS